MGAHDSIEVAHLLFKSLEIAKLKGSLLHWDDIEGDLFVQMDGYFNLEEVARQLLKMLDGKN